MHTNSRIKVLLNLDSTFQEEGQNKWQRSTKNYKPTQGFSSFMTPFLRSLAMKEQTAATNLKASMDNQLQLKHGRLFFNISSNHVKTTPLLETQGKCFKE